jgi:hypothetical protein
MVLLVKKYQKHHPPLLDVVLITVSGVPPRETLAD